MFVLKCVKDEAADRVATYCGLGAHELETLSHQVASSYSLLLVIAIRKVYFDQVKKMLRLYLKSRAGHSFRSR